MPLRNHHHTQKQKQQKNNYGCYILIFVFTACATFLALAPRPAFASVVAPVACWAGLEVCGVCGPTCDAVCTH